MPREGCRAEGVRRGLLVLAHVNLGQLAALEAEGDPILLLLIEGQNGLAHEGIGENAALIEGFLQAGMSFAGWLAAAVDSLGNVIDTIGPILSFLEGVLVGMCEYLAGGADELGYAARKADQSAVHAGEPGNAEGLIVAGDEGDIGALFAEQTDVMLVDGGNAGTHLDALNVLDLVAHLDESLNGIERLGGGGVEMDDDIDIGAFGNFLNEVEGSIGVHAEAEPHVRGHEQDAVSAGFLCFARHLDGFVGVLAVQTGNNGHLVAALLGADLGDSFALGAGEAGDLAGVTVANETLDALIVEALDPAEVSAELGLVDGVVLVEGYGYCGEDSFEVLDLSHCFDLLWVVLFYVSSLSQLRVHPPSRAGLMSTSRAIVCLLHLYFNIPASPCQ